MAKINCIIVLLLFLGCGQLLESNSKAGSFSEETAHYRIEIKTDNNWNLSNSEWEKQLELIKERALNSKNVFNKIELDLAKERILLDLVSYEDLSLRRYLTAKGAIEFRDVYLKEELPVLQEILAEIQGEESLNEHFDSPDFKSNATLGYCRAAKRAQVMGILATKREAGVLPKDLNFMWSLTPTQGLRMGSKKDWFQLYAINRKDSGTTITNSLIAKASSGINEHNGEPVVNLTMDDMGAKFFEEMTTKAAQNNNRVIAIILDNVVVSAPTVNSSIPGGRVQITGGFTTEEAHTLSRILNMSPLLCEMKIRLEESI